MQLRRSASNRAFTLAISCRSSWRSSSTSPRSVLRSAAVMILGSLSAWRGREEARSASGAGHRAASTGSGWAREAVQFGDDELGRLLKRRNVTPITEGAAGLEQGRAALC